MPWQPKGPTIPQGTLRTALTAGWEKGLSRSFLCWSGLNSSTVCHLGCHNIEGHKMIREHPKEGCKDGKDLESKMYEEQLRSLRLFSPEQRSWGEAPWQMHREQRGRAGPFSLMTGEWQYHREQHGVAFREGSGWMEVRKRFFRRPAGVQKVFGHCSQNYGLIFGWSCVESRVGLNDLCGFLPSRDSLWFKKRAIKIHQYGYIQICLHSEIRTCPSGWRHDSHCSGRHLHSN